MKKFFIVVGCIVGGTISLCMMGGFIMAGLLLWEMAYPAPEEATKTATRAAEQAMRKWSRKGLEKFLAPDARVYWSGSAAEAGNKDMAPAEGMDAMLARGKKALGKFKSISSAECYEKMGGLEEGFHCRIGAEFTQGHGRIGMELTKPAEDGTYKIKEIELFKGL